MAYLVIAVYLFAVALNTVIIPYNIISGGISGLGAIYEHVTGSSAAIFIFVVNLFILILGYFLVSPKYAVSSILGANILFPLFITLVPIGAVSQDIFLSTVFGGAITGLGIHFLWTRENIIRTCLHWYLYTNFKLFRSWC